MQRFMIIGRIGQELDMKITETNKKVVEFSIADTEKYGEQEVTTWLNCVAWEGKAETLAKYVHKGDMIYLDGKIRNQKYKTKEGQERFRTYLLVENFTLLPNVRKEKKEEEKVAENWKDPRKGFDDEDMKELGWY